MLAPISWLKDYVDISVSPEVLAKKLVAIGFEVEQVIYQEKQVSKVVVGKIVSVEKHPNADRLRVTQIDIGSTTVQVVTNVPVDGGEIIAVALDGAELSGGHKILKGELRGVMSEGMLCGLEEVGLTVDDIAGQKAGDIIRFDETTKLGGNVLAALGFNDVILDVSVTANRPDCNSIYKLAKEVAVALKTECREPEIGYKTIGDSVKNYVGVEIKDKTLCPRYLAAAVKNIKIFSSPQKIKSRLRAVGIRPINNIVDITNYVLTEIGQPMHAFDSRDLLGSKIIVRRAEDNEHIISLDGKDNKLNNSMLVICDAVKPVAVAGIMGGENSGIKNDTSSIVFESAKFARDSIRRTSRALNLRSDSSARFEKGIDFASQEYGIKRALTLVNETGSGDIVDGLIDERVDYVKAREIVFTTSRIERILGCKVPKTKLISILERLGIAVEEDGKNLIAHVGEDREDIVGVNDLAEEFIRVYGYSHVEPTLFKYATPTMGGKTEKFKNIDAVKNTLAALGLNESVTYSFTTPKFADMLLLPSDSGLRNFIPLVNPLGEGLSVMRTTLCHSMIETLVYNESHFNKEAALFEIGKIYVPKSLPLSELPDEKEYLAVGIYGEKSDFFSLKSVTENLFAALNVKAEYSASNLPYLHPGRAADISVGGKKVGYLGELHPDAAKNYGTDSRIYVAEISLKEVFDAMPKEKKFKAFSKFPQVERDLAVVVESAILAGDMVKAVEDADIKHLIKAEVFDTYCGEQIGIGKKSVAMNFVFSSVERTLTDDEVSTQMQRILNLLKRKFGAKIRL